MDALIEALCAARAYPHPVDAIRVLETHISWVLLSGRFAYKIKKPVALEFLDFKRLEARQHFCLEELRINRRFAPQLYLDVVAITRGPDGPCMAGEGEAIEYAVRMRRFPAGALLAEQVGQGPLPARLWRGLGDDLARLHARLPRSDRDDPSRHGVPARLRDACAQNFRQIRTRLRERADIEQLNALEQQAWSAWRGLERLMWQRYEAGLVRECHGDLHLGNLVVLDGRATPFDAVEFNAAFRWIDQMNELAFLVMDCDARGVPEGGYLALDAWLQRSGDHEGLALFDFFIDYRAIVRAKVALLAATPDLQRYREYTALVTRHAQPRARFLAITCGVSGSGKSTVAEAIAARLPAIRIRADVERKRLFGLAPEDNSRVPGAPDIYTPQAGERTFARLAELAERVLAAGFPVVLDATFIRRALRERFRALASRLGVAFRILYCTAPVEELHRRVAARLADGAEASEADHAVLEAQLAEAEPPDPAIEPDVLVAGAGDEAETLRLVELLRGK